MPNRAAKSRSEFPKMSRALVGFVALTGFIGMLVVWFPVSQRAADFEQSAQASVALRGAHAVRLATSRALEREWSSLTAVAEQIDFSDRTAVRNVVDAVTMAGGRVAWAGFANASGRVVAGSDRYREGDDVTERRWFREGLDGGSVGSVYTPASEKDAADPHAADQVNLSVPVLDAQGETLGVLVYSLRMSWLRGFASDSANELGVELFIVDHKGDVLVENRPADAASLSPEARSFLLMGRAGTRVVDADTSDPHILAVLPSVTTDAMPSFGWQMAVRVPTIAAGGGLFELKVAIAKILLSMFLGLIVFAVLFTAHFIRPIEKLAAIADKIADGDPIYPDEYFTTRESAALSQSLSRIQNQLARPIPGPRTPDRKLTLRKTT